jgi:hypothetical protein
VLKRFCKDKFNLLLLSGFLISFNAFSQESSEPKCKMKGTFYLVWGYNRDWYTRSTLHFKGNNPDGDFDFEVRNTRAHDQPDMQNILHRPLTVPQYNLNFGYFFNDKHDLGIEGSWNHLKYVMYNNEVRHVSGQIYGNNIDKDTLVSTDFLKFEHTNGNNYAMISLVKRIVLLKTKNDLLRINALVKYGVGGLVPKTDSRLFNYHNDGPFRLSGFVTGVNVGLRVDLFRYFFLDTNFQGAFADYTSGIIYGGRVRHHFFSLQYIWSAGINVPLSGKQ